MSIRVARQDFNRSQAGTRADHGRKVWAAMVRRPVRRVDAPSTGTKVISFVMPAAVVRPAICRIAARYRRDFFPLSART